jgi:hypothetical protein
MKIKPVTIAIAIFVLAFFGLRECEAGTLEVGGSVTDVRGEGLVYTESFGTKWDIGMYVTGEMKLDGKPVEKHGGVFGQRIVRKGKFQMGLGVAWHMNTSRLIGSELGYALHLGWDFNDRLGVKWRHWSNAGTTRPNRGLDLALISWRFD